MIGELDQKHIQALLQTGNWTVLRPFRLDPASARAPRVISITDIMGVLIYLGITSAMPGGVTP